jgi:hypothetical protein
MVYIRLRPVKLLTRSIVLLPLFVPLIGYSNSAHATSLMPSSYTHKHATLTRFNAQPMIVFASSVMPGAAIIHDNETFGVQWVASNTGAADSSAFTDHLVITNIPEGCPGSDDTAHAVVFDSNQETDQSAYQEQPLAPGAIGNLMQTLVGPFPAGSYRLTVTLAGNVGNGATTFNCINIISAT